ncbi:MAG: hypothetical protein ACK526_08835 [Planctomyces sp.]|jgi:hypothetical protein
MAVNFWSFSRLRMVTRFQYSVTQTGGDRTAGLTPVRRHFAAALLLIAAVFCSGCGQQEASEPKTFDDLQPVSGRVSFQGKPIAGGTVRLFPVTAASESAKGEVYTAVVAEDGGFRMQTFRAAGSGFGVPAGEYRASFSWSGTPEEVAQYSSDERPEKLPAKLTRQKTSGVQVTVAVGGTVIPDIELK